MGGLEQKADAKQSYGRRGNREPGATLMFSMKPRQMERLNSGQSFGRDSDDLNVLA